MDPSFVTAHLGLGLCYIEAEAPEAAMEEYREAARLVGSDQPLVLALMGHASALAGSEDDARAILARLRLEGERCYLPAEYPALVHIGLGERREALEALQRAFANRSGSMAFLRVDPLLDPLRREPEFAALVRDVGI
jgi:Flp pilus assembly protein TadD